MKTTTTPTKDFNLKSFIKKTTKYHKGQPVGVLVRVGEQCPLHKENGCTCVFGPVGHILAT